MLVQLYVHCLPHLTCQASVSGSSSLSVLASASSRVKGMQLREWKYWMPGCFTLRGGGGITRLPLRLAAGMPSATCTWLLAGWLQMVTVPQHAAEMTVHLLKLYSLQAKHRNNDAMSNADLLVAGCGVVDGAHAIQRLSYPSAELWQLPAFYCQVWPPRRLVWL